MLSVQEGGLWLLFKIWGWPHPGEEGAQLYKIISRVPLFRKTLFRKYLIPLSPAQ